MKVISELKTNINLYVILDLAIKSVQQDKKQFEAFKINRPYLDFCEKQLEILNVEFKTVLKKLSRQGVKFKKYQCINKNTCIYSFLCRGEMLSFQYTGDQLLEQKVKITSQLLKWEVQI